MESRLLIAIAVSLLAMGCGGVMEQPSGPSDLSVAADAATRLKDARVLFAHQSVGGNIVDGILSLQKEVGSNLHVIDLEAASTASTGFIAHARLGQNGDPKGKTDAFVAALEGGLGQRVDIALQKYCYADFDRTTNAADVFTSYQRGIDRIRHDFPDVSVVHVTAPLMAVQSGPKAVIKKLIGRAPDHYEENLVREQFNDLMRRAYQGREPLFDLASLESSRPGQPRDALSLGSSTVYALLPEYTTDGGHLNAGAERRVAAAFLSFLADVAGKRDSRSSRPAAAPE